jgi:hypothetical protein
MTRRGKDMGFTLKEALALACRGELCEVARWTGPEYSVVVYRAGPGFVVRRIHPGSDLLEIRVCQDRSDVLIALTFKMRTGTVFAKCVWDFLAEYSDPAKPSETPFRGVSDRVAGSVARPAL